VRAVVPFLVVAVGVALVAMPARARAEGAPTVGVRVRVAAPGGCATESSFRDALSLRTDRLVSSDARDARAPRIEVTVRAAGKRGSAASEAVVGELRIVRAGAPSETRRLRAASCAELVEGLSLVAALAFDPAAKAPAPPPEAPAEAEPAPDGPSTSPGADPAPSPLGSLVGAPVRDAAPSVPPAVSPSAPGRWHGSVAASVGGRAPGDPGPAIAWGGFVELAREGGLVSPSFRLGGAHSRVSTIAQPSLGAAAAASSVGADLAWTVVRASACPLRFAIARGVAMRPCVEVDSGVLAASATGVARGATQTLPWVAPGLAARAVFTPSPRFFFELQAALVAPVVRDELVVEPSVGIYRAPAVVPSADLAAGVRLF